MKVFIIFNDYKLSIDGEDTYTLFKTAEETSDLVKVKIYISEEVTTDGKLEAIRIIKKNYGFGLKEAKDYIDSCIGKHSTLPRDLKLEEARKLVDILGYFGIDVTIIKNY